MNLFQLIDVTHALGLVVVVVLLAVALVVALLRWERYRPRRRPLHALPTSEVFIDPESQRRLRVWVDPATGARDYREEPDILPTPLPPLQRPGLHLPPSAPPASLPPGTPPQP